MDVTCYLCSADGAEYDCELCHGKYCDQCGMVTSKFLCDVCRYVPPFHVVPMPLDAKGRGPELAEPVKTVYEVWDAACQTVSVHSSASEAKEARDEIAKKWASRMQ